MIPGINPRQMQKMMKKMGMQQVEIDAKEVIIKCEDKDIVISNPNVSKVNVMGQETYQVVGEAHERSPEEETTEINEDDIKTVIDQTSVDHDKARKTLEEAKGDIAEAILKLKEE